MSFLRKKLDDLKRPFGKGEKWEKYAPAINAFDTFLFVPKNVTSGVGTHIKDRMDIKRLMIFVVLGAPDVAMTEAAIGSGLTTFIFFFALKKVRESRND